MPPIKLYMLTSYISRLTFYDGLKLSLFSSLLKQLAFKTYMYTQKVEQNMELIACKPRELLKKRNGRH